MDCKYCKKSFSSEYAFRRHVEKKTPCITWSSIKDIIDNRDAGKVTPVPDWWTFEWGNENMGGGQRAWGFKSRKPLCKTCKFAYICEGCENSLASTRKFCPLCNRQKNVFWFLYLMLNWIILTYSVSDSSITSSSASSSDSNSMFSSQSSTMPCFTSSSGSS